MDEEKGLNKRAVAVVLIPVLLVAIFLVLFFVVFNGDETDETTVEEVKSNVVISEAEQLEVESEAERVIQIAGNFGVKKENVSAENIDEMATLLETDETASGYYFTSRANSYSSLSDFIMEGSPIDYSVDEVNNWTNAFETSFRNSFSVIEVSADAGEKGSYINSSDQRLKSVSVSVVFSSNQTMYVENGSEFGAERSYSVMSNDFESNSATMIFVEVEGEWKLYDIKNLSNEFLLSTWNAPAEGAYADTQFGFKETDKLVPPGQNVPTE